MVQCPNNTDFFYPLMENHYSKIFCMAFAAISLTVTITGCVGIVWFINTSTNSKETLINRFVLRAITMGFEYTFFVQVFLWINFHPLVTKCNLIPYSKRENLKFKMLTCNQGPFNQTNCEKNILEVNYIALWPRKTITILKQYYVELAIINNY